MATVATRQRVVSSSEPIALRTALPSEAGAIHALIVEHLAEGHLLPRELGEIAVHAHRFVVAIQNDEVLAATLDMGGAGGIQVASHLVGDEMRRMIDEPDQRAAINDSLAGVFAAMTVTTNPIPVKAALNLLGHDVGGLRLPLVSADEEQTAAIRDALERHGLLAATR